jgi:uncharacterized 2Fe-2S/4Fe-4S cluster protein (DUF4445 family)
MGDSVRIELRPSGESLEVERGAPLQDVLFAHGVEFPCGSRGRCRGCRIKVLEGWLPETPEQQEILSPQELASGWRLACRSCAAGPLTLEIAQWQTPILADYSTFAFTAAEGLGVAVDLGTTTLVAQLLDLRTGHVLAVRTALNPQMGHGSDVMSRVHFAVIEGGQRKLEQVIRKRIGAMIAELQASPRSGGERVRRVVVVGNTVMHHLFCGIDVEPLAHSPFEPARDGLEVFEARDFGWEEVCDASVCFLPCLGGFVGSDILAGVLATGMHESEALVGLIDLGTNGEIVMGNRERMLCASTAAGPAFEGGRISMGMRAATGAITGVDIDDGRVRCRVLGNVPPRGICGSGLVDAAAAGLELGVIRSSGRLAGGQREWMLCPPVILKQQDIRELQLAKAAIAAGVRILLDRWGAAVADVTRLYLAGAFGNYINRTSARRIGLIDFPEEKVQPVGNTALLGAKLALFSCEDRNYIGIRKAMRHIPLAADPRFQDIYAEEMAFPTGE